MTIQGWSKNLWRVKSVACHLLAVGTAAIGGKKRDVHFIIADAETDETPRRKIAVSMTPAEAETFANNLLQYVKLARDYEGITG